MNEFEFLTNYNEDRIRNYIKDNLEKAFEISAVYKELDEVNKNEILKEENGLRIYMNKEILEPLEINFSSNRKFENNNN